MNFGNPIYDTVFEDNESDKATAKKLVGLTKLSGRFAQPVFGQMNWDKVYDNFSFISIAK